MALKTRVLIVDDEEAICQIVKYNLERNDEYEVFYSTNGKEGIELAKTKNPDLILLDIYMPEMSGPDVVEHLSADATTKNIPVIFLTGVVTQKDVEESKGVIGGRRFIAKPITSEKLKSTIESVLLENAQSRR